MSAEYGSEDFDRDVERVIREWEGALDLLSEWSSYDGEQRAVVLDEWQHTTAIQFDLEDYARSHTLTEAQKAQYDKLRDIMARHSATLRKMGYRIVPPGQTRAKAVA